MFKKFPNNFIFGAAMSAEQTEGHGTTYKALTNWDLFYSKYPERFFNNVGPNITSDLMNHYSEDIKLFKEIGLTGLRYGFSWSRLFPEGDYTKPNKKAIIYYYDFIKSLKDNGINPFMSLVHFDMPSYLIKNGGFLNQDYIAHFTKYCQFIFQEFGKQVEYFVTFNEPMVVSECSYLLKYHWPLENDFKKMINSIHIMNLCNAIAVQELRKINQTSKIGLVLDLNYPYPKDDTNESDLEAVNNYRLLKFYSYSHPAMKGCYKKEYLELLKTLKIDLNLTDNDLELLKNNIIDFIGVNFYRPTRLQKPKVKINLKGLKFDQFFEEYILPNAEMNKDRGWEIYPQALYDTIMWVKHEYNNFPMFITENGMGVSNEEQFIINNQVNDQYRIDFVKRHLDSIYLAINDGANVGGYFMWAAIDNWSWINAYKNRYGFIRVELENQKRTIKKSGLWYKEISKNRGYDD